MKVGIFLLLSSSSVVATSVKAEKWNAEDPANADAVFGEPSNGSPSAVVSREDFRTSGRQVTDILVFVRTDAADAARQRQGLNGGV